MSKKKFSCISEKINNNKFGSQSNPVYEWACYNADMQTNWLDKIKIFSKVIIEKEGKILALKRRESDKRRAGKWDLPGGGFEKGEEIVESACREVMEEVGLEVSDLKPVFVQSWQEDGVDWVCLSFSAEKFTGEVVLSEEHSEFEWVEADEFLKLDVGIEGVFLHKAIKAWSRLKCS